MLTKLSLFLGLLSVAAAPAERRTLTKRHSHCWGTNVAGCEYPIIGSQAAVVTEVGTCSEIGIDILKQGGNAADAMIASALCVGVISGYHSGIGGGGFMIIRYNNPNGTHGYETIDFRETMPAAGNETLYSAYGVNQTKSTIGGLAVGVPGELRGWQMLHDRHGSLPWFDLFQPAINVARNGFLINGDYANFFAPPSGTFILNDTDFGPIYAPNGSFLGVGEMAYRPKLADTLETIANEGVEVFYRNSSIATNMIKKIQATGGIMTEDDLAGYTAIVREAAMIEYRDKRIFSTVAPSSGTVTLSAIKILEGFDASAQDTDPQINITTQRFIEAMRLAYGQRATLGDPAFTANVTSVERSYLTEEVVKAARSRIVAGETFPTSYYDPSEYVPSAESGTSHLATADASGMAVSLTTTVNTGWGSRVMTEDGIILNNEMDDFGSPGQLNSFGFAASPINYIAPGKRPQSSISSTLVEDKETGEFMMATGAAGGSRIITATAQEIYHYVDQGLNASQCTAHPRWHDQLNGKTDFELPVPSRGLPGYDNSTVAYLAKIGYNITYSNSLSGSTSHMIGRLPSGKFLAGTDPRKVAAYGAAL